MSVSAVPAGPQRYSSIAALSRVLPARQLIPFWLAIGLTFASLGFLIDVIASGRSAPLTLALNVFFAGTVSMGLVWTRVTSRQRAFVAVAAVDVIYTILAS